jgi:hypothetical protein|tara:strand:+ start:436 stop:981 length:546 start_codon:yes stop_codon:yes gene_type:complete
MNSIDLKNQPLLCDNKLLYLNNNDDCIICSQILNKSTDLLVINNICKCYNAINICEECFINWVSKYNECILCRKKYDIDFKNRLQIYDSNDKKLLLKLSEFKNIDISVPIDDVIIQNDIITTQYNSTFSPYILCKSWIYENKSKIIIHITVYCIIISFILSIKKSLYYQKNDTNYTHGIIF